MSREGINQRREAVEKLLLKENLPNRVIRQRVGCGDDLIAEVRKKLGVKAPDPNYYL